MFSPPTVSLFKWLKTWIVSINEIQVWLTWYNQTAKEICYMKIW
jgi:hypothetical protein